MKNEDKHKLTLDQPANYQIKVPGELGEEWADWIGDIAISVERADKGLPVTTLTGALDQSALLGLLRRLYSLGLPLISIICLDYK